jgi:excisionase family DNA binding protein
MHKPLSKSELLLIREKEAARLLQISNRAMWALAASGAIPFVKIGRSKRYDPDDLRAYIRAQKTGVAK